MQRINTPDSLFHDGDQSTGVQGTLVLSDWLNAVQEELAKAVEGLGLTLDPAQSNQLLTALLSSFVNVSGDVMTGNLTLPELHVMDANARVRRDGNFAMFENDVSFAVISSLSPVHLTTNAKRQGADWNRIDTTLPAALCRVDDDGNLYSYYAAAGANPISWGLSRKIWAAGNDGAGSGLDADLLDGLQPAVSGNANTIAQRDGVGSLAVANATAPDLAIALGQLAGSFAGNGYLKIPVWDPGAGVMRTYIIQWGSVAMGDIAGGAYGFTSTVTFPIGFPNAIIRVYTSKTGDATAVATGARSITLTSMQAYAEEWSASAQAADATLTWYAFGY